MAEDRPQSIKLQATIPAQTAALLDGFARHGIHGSTRAEVAAYILNRWFEIEVSEQKYSKNDLHSLIQNN